MLIVSEVFTNIFLGIAAYMDSRHKKIPALLPAAGLLIGIVLLLFSGDRNMGDLLTGMAPGSAMLLVALLTGEKVGYGDGLMLLTLGVLLPPEECIMSFCIALVLAAVAGIILLALKKVTGKSRLPFLPFLMLGYIVMLGVYL